MIRDWDLYRDILLIIEGDASPHNSWLEVQIEGCEAERIAGHVEMLYADDLITIKDLRSSSDKNAIHPINLTSDGRFLAEKLRDDDFWRNLKPSMSEFSGVLTVEALKSLISSFFRS